MNNINHIQKLIRICLLGICGFFAILLWQQVSAPIPTANDKIKTQIKSDTELVENENIHNVSFPEIAAFDEIVERPLFNATRQPFVAAASEAIKKATPQKKKTTTGRQNQLSLSAVVITSKKQIAILQNVKDKSLQRIALGDTVDGWTLNEVTPNSIKLSKGDEIKNLELEVKSNTIKKSQTPNVSTSKTSNKTSQSMQREKDVNY